LNVPMNFVHNNQNNAALCILVEEQGKS